MLPVQRILIVEDEAAIAELIAANLRHHGFMPIWSSNGEAAIREVNTVLPDAILLDWMLPGAYSGPDLLRKWRGDARTKNIPILMITAKGEEQDKVTALDAGADDHITKPFSPGELMARIRSVVRRRTPEHALQVLTVGELVMDGPQQEVRHRGSRVKLGPTEYRLLHHLMNHPNRVLTRAQILDRVWGDHVFIEERTVDVHIKRLRQALGEAGSMIETVRSVGYKFVSR
jgi:two-component system phosphate regulon response regulator PhoB